MTRLLLVGQAPSQESDGKPPGTGRCGAFLASLMGLSQEQMLAEHDFVNVLEKWPGKDINGDRFPILEAKARARRLLPMMGGRVVVLLGKNVARAFGADRLGYFEWYTLKDPENPGAVVTSAIAIIPHPSGRVRIWNSAQSRETARRFFRNLLNPVRISA